MKIPVLVGGSCGYYNTTCQFITQDTHEIGEIPAIDRNSDERKIRRLPIAGCMQCIILKGNLFISANVTSMSTTVMMFLFCLFVVVCFYIFCVWGYVFFLLLLFLFWIMGFLVFCVWGSWVGWGGMFFAGAGCVCVWGVCFPFSRKVCLWWLEIFRIKQQHKKKNRIRRRRNELFHNKKNNNNLKNYSGTRENAQKFERYTFDVYLHVCACRVLRKKDTEKQKFEANLWRFLVCYLFLCLFSCLFSYGCYIYYFLKKHVKGHNYNAAV